MSDAALPATRWGGAAHVFVTDLDAPDPSADDRHHLERVLRLRAGELVTLSDGGGRWQWARVGASFEPLGAVMVDAEPHPVLTVAFALLKGDRNELVTQKLTELGIDAIVPMHTERCVARWDGARSDRQRERLARVARDASMQSRRVWLPRIDEVRPFADVAAREGAALAAIDGSPLDVVPRTVLVGPEGGWGDTEDAAALPRVRLGDLVLRAETAAITAGAILAALRSGLVFPYAT